MLAGAAICGSSGLPRPFHKVRVFAHHHWSEKAIPSIMRLFQKQFRGFNIFVFCEVPFSFARSLLAKTSAHEFLLDQSLCLETSWARTRIAARKLVFCKGNRHTKKLTHKVFSAFASLRSCVNLAQKSLGAPRILMFIPRKIGTQTIGTQSLACQSVMMWVLCFRGLA